MSKFGSLIAGGVIGAVAALLYAPRRGEETRALVSEKVSALWGEARDWGAAASANAQSAYQDAQDRGSSVWQDVAAKGQEFAQNAQARGAEFYSAATTRVQDAASAVSPAAVSSNDDLREKIEAARARIAAQVVKNAEEAQAQAPVDVAAAADAAADTAVDTAEQVVSDVADAADVADEAGKN